VDQFNLRNQRSIAYFNLLFIQLQRTSFSSISPQSILSASCPPLEDWLAFTKIPVRLWWKAFVLP